VVESVKLTAATTLAVVLGWVSEADAMAVVIACGVLAAALTAMASAVRLPIISRPGRWLWRRLVSEPAAAFLYRVLNGWADQEGGVFDRLANLERQHHRNGGSSTRDRIEKIAERVGADPPPDVPEH
jgi:hypothetical protein